ncbi:hypothetical protein TWF192_005764 [Orbilia oligospora]|uniref:Uncharacterized protein n=1 Tax=Orbilia oligospora TaxID=2813651 RepID=A0A6G1MNR7_ORBOL|nr:hypothetical protein TWF191_003877 [Orbilia oligospora]KAF3263483.1 hypothetical protein TWF192_005764 [Orbilia oligospora]
MDTSIENQEFLYQKAHYLLNFFKFETGDSAELKTVSLYTPGEKLFIDNLRINFPECCWTACFTESTVSAAATYPMYQTSGPLCIADVLHSIDKKLSPNHCHICNYVAPHYVHILIHYLFRHDAITIGDDLKCEDTFGAATVEKLRSWIRADQSLETILNDVLADGVKVRRAMLPQFLLPFAERGAWPLTTQKHYQFFTPLDLFLGPSAQVWGNSKPYLFNMDFSADFPEFPDDTTFTEDLGERFTQFM